MKLRSLSALEISQVLVGDLILMEVLRGARDDTHALRIEGGLRKYPIVQMLDPAVAIQAASYCRTLRQRGITIRNGSDLIIGSFCLAHGHRLLHEDRDFDHIEAHFALKIM